MTAFERAWAFVQAAEGGAAITNDPDDPGGLTKWGISQRAYPQLDIRSLTEDQAKAIFRRDYWDRCSCSQMPAQVAIALVDAAFNLGPSRAVRQLQAALHVTVDGVPGPKTIGAAQRALQSESVNDMLSHRLLYYAGLDQLEKFQRGWFLRVLRLKDALVSL